MNFLEASAPIVLALLVAGIWMGVLTPSPALAIITIIVLAGFFIGINQD